MAKLLIERLFPKKYHDCDVDRYIPTLCKCTLNVRCRGKQLVLFSQESWSLREILETAAWRVGRCNFPLVLIKSMKKCFQRRNWLLFCLFITKSKFFLRQFIVVFLSQWFSTHSFLFSKYFGTNKGRKWFHISNALCSTSNFVDKRFGRWKTSHALLSLSSLDEPFRLLE